MVANNNHHQQQHMQHSQHLQQQQQHHPHQQQQQQRSDNNDFEEFLNILIDENNPSPSNSKSPQLSPHPPRHQPFNIQQQLHHPQQQHQQQNNPFRNNNNNNNTSPSTIQLATSPSNNTVPEVKIKCEDNSASDYPHSDGDGYIDDVSPFHSGVSSPGSSCSAMSGPGSPIMMDSNSQPPFNNQNYLTPESAFYMQQPGSPTHSGNQSGDSAGSSYKYDPRPLGRKKRRTLVPDDKKNTEYWEKRKRNNLAARRSREERRTKELQTFETMKHLQQENNALKQTIKMLMESQNELQKEIFSLRHCLEVSQAMLNNKQMLPPPQQQQQQASHHQNGN